MKSPIVTKIALQALALPTLKPQSAANLKLGNEGCSGHQKLSASRGFWTQDSMSSVGTGGCNLQRRAASVVQLHSERASVRHSNLHAGIAVAATVQADPAVQAPKVPEVHAGDFAAAVILHALHDERGHAAAWIYESLQLDLGDDAA